MAKSYYQRAHGIVLTCALNNKNSFYNLNNWLNSINENTQEDSIQLIIVANKCDLITDREVSKQDIENKAKEMNVQYFETSAKENINLEDAFETIINKVYMNVYNNKPRGFSIADTGNDEVQFPNKRKCCY